MAEPGAGAGAGAAGTAGATGAIVGATGAIVGATEAIVGATEAGAAGTDAPGVEEGAAEAGVAEGVGGGAGWVIHVPRSTCQLKKACRKVILQRTKLVSIKISCVKIFSPYSNMYFARVCNIWREKERGIHR